MHWYCYLTVKGSNQGPFKSDDPHGRKGAHLCYGYHFEGFVHDDPSRGASSAVRAHEPLRVMKGRDRASVQFSKAFWNNEVLSEVVLEIVANDGKGNEDVLVEKYTLEGATVARLKRVGGAFADATGLRVRPAAGGEGNAVATESELPAELEEVSFRFTNAKHESAAAQTMALYEYTHQPR